MEAVLSDDQFFQELFALFGGAKSFSLSIGMLLLVKVLALAFKWKLGEYVGLWRLTIISGLTVMSVVLVNITSGVPLVGALFNGATFAALSVFLNQAYRQYQNYKKDELKKSLNTEPLTVEKLMRKP